MGGHDKLGSLHVCENCGREFYVTRGREAQVARKGHHVRYCSSTCYTANKSGERNPNWGRKWTAQMRARQLDIREFKLGKDAAALRETVAPMLADGASYEAIARSLHVRTPTLRRHLKGLGLHRNHKPWGFRRPTGSTAAVFQRVRAIGRCQRCGWKEHPEVLQVHHRIGKRRGNAIWNLVLLCPTCHMVVHYTHKSGAWHTKNGAASQLGVGQ
jgi:hypothetical protein